MAINKLRNSYKNLVKRQAPPVPEKKSSEETLDELLNAHHQRSSSASGKTADGAPRSRLDIFRDKLSGELGSAFEELKRKYESQGLVLNLDAEEFLLGGRRLNIEFRLQNYSVRLEGTVLESGIAFNEIRSIGGVAGAISSGPTLRIRDLTADEFREFVCGRIALLLRSVLRERRR